MDPLAGSSWSNERVVAGFRRSPPNERLMACVAAERQRRNQLRVLDIGCGAGRNAMPIAHLGCTVLGTDLSWPMLETARERLAAETPSGRVGTALAPMEALPARDAAFDFVVAHGIWNLARTAREFRRAVREAARVARPGAALFVFTFSRHTLPRSAEPVPGETFVFTQFSGAPQCFLTEDELVEELMNAGFLPDPDVPLREHNRQADGTLITPRVPVIYEVGFRRDSHAGAGGRRLRRGESG